MKISEAVLLTGLTKKAIHYYEEQGLLAPTTNANNEYRDYSEEDIKTLTEIQILRQLDIPVKDIKRMKDRPAQIKSLLAEHLNRIEQESIRLESNKQQLQQLLKQLDDQSTSTQEVTQSLKHVQYALEMDLAGRRGYAEQALKRLFPGNYGVLISMQFGPFLQQPLDTPQKKAAWLEMVLYLDNHHSIAIPKEMSDWYEALSPEEAQEMGAAILESRLKMMKMTEEQAEQLVNDAPKLVEARNKLFNGVPKTVKERDQLVNDTTKRVAARNPLAGMSSGEVTSMVMSAQEALEVNGYYQKFIRNLKIISEDYANMQNMLEKLQDRLHLQYDDKGAVFFATEDKE